MVTRVIQWRRQRRAAAMAANIQPGGGYCIYERGAYLIVCNREDN